jgi:hypothetical protein
MLGVLLLAVFRKRVLTPERMHCSAVTHLGRRCLLRFEKLAASQPELSLSRALSVSRAMIFLDRDLEKLAWDQILASLMSRYRD